MEKDADLTDLNLDQLLEKMELDELADAPLITPVNYAKPHANLTPQIVYYYIRRGRLRTYVCPCGRKCIKKADADELFRKLGKFKPDGSGTDLQQVDTDLSDEEQR